MDAHDDIPVGPPDARETPRFAGPDTFARLSDVPQVSVALVGIPFDAGVCYRAGAHLGPGGIRAGALELANVWQGEGSPTTTPLGSEQSSVSWRRGLEMPLTDSAISGRVRAWTALTTLPSTFG